MPISSDVTGEQHRRGDRRPVWRGWSRALSINGQEWWGSVSQHFSGRRRSAENEAPGRGLARPGGDFPSLITCIPFCGHSQVGSRSRFRSCPPLAKNQRAVTPSILAERTARQPHCPGAGVSGLRSRNRPSIVGGVSPQHQVDNLYGLPCRGSNRTAQILNGLKTKALGNPARNRQRRVASCASIATRASGGSSPRLSAISWPGTRKRRSICAPATR
jgi:hypothetical protein